MPVPYRVLIVDDNPDFRESTAVLLASLGQDILVAGNGVEALALCERDAPQVVLMDLSMPGLNGHEVARLMRRVPHMQDALLIAISGHDGPDDVQRSYQAGFQYHMAKPFDWTWFKAVLDSFANGKLDR
ncbi:MAG: response regulator [Burkholderiaceae bacterium]